MLEAARAALFAGNVRPTGGIKRKPLSTRRTSSDAKLRTDFDRETLSGPEAELAQLRKECQYQQDRLYAWGVFWDELSAQRAQQDQSQSQMQSPSPGVAQAGSPSTNVKSDSKVQDDHSAMGDLVASILDEVKKLLDQSSRLTHPDRFEVAKTQGFEQQQEGASPRQHMSPSGNVGSPTVDRKENLQSERDLQPTDIQSGKQVIDQLTNCIDVLYSLVDPSEDTRQIVPTKNKKEEELSDSDDANTALMATAQTHPLYIDFSLLQPMHDPAIDGEFVDSTLHLPPPSYDDAQHHANPQARSIYFYAQAQAHVLVDLVATKSSNLASLLLPFGGEGSTTPIERAYQLAENLSGRGLLSWDGHMKVLGFTVAGSKKSVRLGLVYALPAPSDPTALQSYQTLTSSLINGNDHELDASIPPLENKFRLAYNVVLLATNYLAHGSTHGYIRSNNIVFLKESENPRISRESYRSPYFLQPIQALAGPSSVSESVNEAIYHYPDAGISGYGTIASHDVYSVGLILLEIGMWAPLRKFWKPKYEDNRHRFVDRLRRTYTPKLASKCGSRYMKIVQKCLGAPTELSDRTNVCDAAEFLLEIMKELAQCCILDEAGTPSPLDLEVFEAMIDESKANQPSTGENDKAKAAEKALPALPAETVSDQKAKRAGHSSTKRRSAASATGQRPSLHKFPDLPIPQPKLNMWNTCLLPKLQKVLTDVLVDSPDAASANLMMIGPSEEKAMTTIVIQCCDTGRVHEELKARLKGRLRLGRGWGLVIVKGDIRRSGQGRKRNVARRAVASSNGGSGSEEKTFQQEYQSLPTSGASIGAFKDGDHLPPVSFGGTILIDGKPYGMSVHHMLDDVSDRGSDVDDTESDDEQEQEEIPQPDVNIAHRSSARFDSARFELDAMGSHMGTSTLASMDDLDISDVDEEMDGDFQLYDSDSDTSTIRPDYSMFDDDGNEYWFMEDGDSVPDLEDDEMSQISSSADSDLESIGDKPGLFPGSIDVDDDEYCVTQPALDDVEEDFFPSIEDRDDDHLSSHSLGYIYASSGIRRKVYQDNKHEIDWALIRVNKDRCGFTHRRSRVKPQAVEAIQPHLTKIASLAALPNMKVQSVGRTSGPAFGRISPAMSLIKFHGRNSFSSSYTIEGGFGRPGDSGAWVWNGETGELCGHVLAWADGLKVAFLGPMEIIVEDIKERLGCETVELVGQAVQRERESKARRRAATQPTGSAITGGSQGLGLENTKAIEQLQRAKELEVALKRISLNSTSESRAVSPAERNGEPARSQTSRCSSASSGYVLSDNDGNANSENRVQRFDVRTNAMQMPMARAS